jgi:APA family basic amino acid/polyamine antiporter
MSASGVAPQSNQLVRQLGVATATALVVSNMIGVGIFTSTGFMAGDLGSVGWIFAIWIVGAICALAGAFCYSELGVNFPSSGGEYVYLTQAYGPTWGFMTGWVSFFAGFSAPIAVAALAFSSYLSHFWPSLGQDQTVIGSGAFSLHIGPGQLVASALILAFTVLNFFGLGRVAVVQNVLTWMKVVVLVGLVVLGFTAGTGDWGNLSLTAVRTSSRPIELQFFVSLFFVYLGYSGWNAATYVAEELKTPARTLPIALAFGTSMVAVLYLLLNAVFIYAAPLEQMKGVVAVGSLAASKLFGPEIAGVFSALMAVGLMSSVSAMVIIGPRVYYAMAKNGAFLPAAAHVDPRWHTPVYAIAAQGIVAAVLTMTPFRDLVNFIGFVLNFFAGLAVASLFLFRKRPTWRKLGVVSFAWPLVPIVFLFVAALMTVIGATLEPNTAMAGAATIGAGALFYHFYLRKA